MTCWLSTRRRWAKPLFSYRVIIDLISAPTTATGLTVQCQLDPNVHPKGIAVSKKEMDAVNIERADFLGEWNYVIRPAQRSSPSG